MYHIVVGDEAAKPLQEAILSEESLKGEVCVLRDILHVGPLQNAEEKNFSETRTAFWEQIVTDKNLTIVNDMARISDVVTAMSKDENEVVWFWLAPTPADVCAYYWLLQFFTKYTGRFFVVNIANLPFLNEAGKVFYPKNISEILPKELVKARKLARAVTVAETELDEDEWIRLVQENAPIRTHEGGKKIASREENFYDEKLMSFCSHQFQKASKIVHQAMSKFYIPTGDVFLGWRLKTLATNGSLQLQGDINKLLKDFEVRLPVAAAEGELNLNSNAEAL